MATDPYGLTGRVAVVTGGGSGIGRAIAIAFGQAGAKVAILDRGNGGGDVRAAIEAGGGAAIAISCDVSDKVAVEAAAGDVEGAFGGADILVNNAGMIRAGGLRDLSLADWNGLLSVNLTGYFLCAQIFARQMRSKWSGAIVNISSIASHHATPMAGAYSVAKAGVLMLSRQMAIEWGGDGIRSNCVSPGMILTPLSQAMYDRPGIAERRAETIPGGRIGRPEDIAEAVLFLASDRAAYLTGDEMTVDGGFTRNIMNLIPRAGYDSGKN